MVGVMRAGEMCAHILAGSMHLSYGCVEGLGEV